jgi:hypothetical protein
LLVPNGHSDIGYEISSLDFVSEMSGGRFDPDLPIGNPNDFGNCAAYFSLPDHPASQRISLRIPSNFDPDSDVTEASDL